MRFEDLPDNWNTLPLDDAPLAAGVIDLVIGHHDRLRDTSLILPCDDRDVGLPAPRPHQRCGLAVHVARAT